ncbi:MAG: helicase C-terminal domain-containing protein [Bacillota bacterium]
MKKLHINDIMTGKVISKIKKEIEESSGREVYFKARIDYEQNLIVDFSVLARGNKTSVPAIISELKPGNMVIHNHPSGVLEPSGPDIRIASHVGNKGVGFAIINNEVEEIYTVVEPQQPQEIKQLKADEIVSLFSPKGEMAQNLNDYEFREQQLRVVEKVIDSFNQGQNYFIEAGTGTGKSFAYLIPALYWNDLNERPVVISTNTINLQEQIINKDLVFLKKILPFSFKSVLVKGRGNYICRRRIKNLEDQSDELFSDEPKKEIQFNKLLNWLDNTKNGSRSDIDFVVKNEIWSQVVSESDLCLNTKCNYFDSCFFMKARKEIYDSDILVVNHHLLLADANLKEENRGLLPDYKHLIVDEAHNFERVATHHLGRPFTYNNLERFLSRIDTSRFSLITRLRNKVGAVADDNKKDILKIIDKIIAQVKRVQEMSRQYFSTLQDYYGDQEENMLRITEEMLSTESWQEVCESGDDFADHLKKLGYHLEKLYKNMHLLNPGDREDLEELFIELELASNKCQSLIGTLDFNINIAEESKDDYVFWLEKEKRYNSAYVSQNNAPLNISKLLPDILWQRLENVIITSATLTVNNNFKFFRKSLGVSDADELQVASPFDYKSQARLLIPDDIPPANAQDFLDQIMDDFREMLISYQGKTMVLFTSYYMLNFCLRQTRTAVNKAGLNILAQGEYPRHYIINNFKANQAQIIFGTVSFWEGIDIKGDNLQYLIIMKLPFPVPSRPVAAARREKMQKEGKNPFYHYSLPRAVIRFKQGFGRLIRSRQDKGLIISLDNRLVTKSYGKIFLNSLPEGCPVERKEMSSLPEIDI